MQHARGEDHCYEITLFYYFPTMAKYLNAVLEDSSKKNVFEYWTPNIFRKILHYTWTDY